MSRAASIGLAMAAALVCAVAAWWLLRPSPAPAPIGRVVLGDGVPPAVGDELELGWLVRVVPAGSDPHAVVITAETEGDRLLVRVGDHPPRAALARNPGELAAAAAEAVVADLGPPGSLDYPPAERAAAGCLEPLAWRYWRRARRARTAGETEVARSWARDAVNVDPGCVMAHLELAATHARGEEEGVLSMARAAAGASDVSSDYQAEIRAWNAYYRGMGTGSPPPTPRN